MNHPTGIASHAPASAIYRPALHVFSIVCVVVAFALITLGGTVTSKGVGMAVPDWPTTFNYNMFLFPPDQWKGGIFWEHSHRLMGSLVGMLTIAISVWLWLTHKSRPWLQAWGGFMLMLVVVQGVMGGLRVTQSSIGWAIVHGINGQIFLCGSVLIAAATSKWWIESQPSSSCATSNTNASAATPACSCAMAEHDCPMTRLLKTPGGKLRLASLIFLGVLVIQLTLGALMRHTGSGLAIPDFPASMGQVIPPFDQASIEAYEATLPWDEARPIFTPAQVAVHFSHRVWAIVVVLVAAVVLPWTLKSRGNQSLITWPAITLIALLVIQVTLGMFVIWSGRHPEIATAHQATGAATLAMAALLAIRLLRIQPQDVSVSAPQSAPLPSRDTVGLQGAGA